MEMNKGKEIMELLRPNGGWVIYGEDFDSIQYFDDCQPVTKNEFDDTANRINNLLEEKAILQTTKRQALLDKLGITEDEARLLLGGN